MPPCQETTPMMHRGGAFGNMSQQQPTPEWDNASTIRRQDSLTYSVSDAGDYDDFADESFEMYCNRMDSKEVVVVFGHGFHPFQQVISEGQVVDEMMQQVQSMQITSQTNDSSNSNKTQTNRPWQFPQPTSNKQSGHHGVFRRHEQRNVPTAVAS